MARGMRFLLLPGQAHDVNAVAPVIRGVSVDADWLLQDLDRRGAAPVTLPKAICKIRRDDDMEVCKWLRLAKKTVQIRNISEG